MKIYCKCILLALLLSCNQKQNKIKILGYINNIPASKVYLTDAYVWEKVLDSAEYVNGEFCFELDINRFNEPFCASIFVPDSNRKHNTFLFFINYITSSFKDTFANSGLFLTRGVNILKGDYSEKLHRVSVEPTKEASLYFDPKTSHFGSIVFKDRMKQINFLEKTIRQHPYSYFLLQQLYQNKALYTKPEIEKLVSLFDTSIAKSPTANLLKFYVTNIIPDSASIPNMFLTKPDNTKGSLFEKKGKITMLVFWASWCSPCRKEIPELKKISTLFASRGLIIKSISIDEDLYKWHKALKEENMSWEQFLIPDSEVNKVKAQFRISSVPIILFLDKENIVFNRIVGYDTTNLEKYKRIINDQLIKDVN
ncbi:MAG: hypothetical protein B6D37_10865 [Sphingobacteriales bacterium UTBCD1]|jgi:thiol-disulfide isomerase/thioredoxin|nr:MAG: hypothetical protein B6D37_10865 [Sphingobacteriales bacterium UTBCD1]